MDPCSSRSSQLPAGAVEVSSCPTFQNPVHPTCLTWSFLSLTCLPSGTVFPPLETRLLTVKGWNWPLLRRHFPRAPMDDKPVCFRNPRKPHLKFPLAYCPSPGTEPTSCTKEGKRMPVWDSQPILDVRYTLSTEVLLWDLLDILTLLNSSHETPVSVSYPCLSITVSSLHHYPFMPQSSLRSGPTKKKQ